MNYISPGDALAMIAIAFALSLLWGWFVSRAEKSK